MVLFLIVNASYPHTKKSVQFQLQYNYCGNLSLQDPVHVIVFHVKFESSSFLHCTTTAKDCLPLDHLRRNYYQTIFPQNTHY